MSSAYKEKAPAQPDCIVQKYGGSSLQDVACLKRVASLIQQRHKQGQRLCVVVSAMGDTTNNLLSQAKAVSPSPAARELDMLLTCGERMSMALLAMALHELRVPCVSFTGSQSGILTDGVHTAAHIVDVRPVRVLQQLQQGKVVIVAGFQGVSPDREITTLQRGGSDATAVALAAALGTCRCEIYSDVQGVYTADPHVVPQAQLLPKVHFDTMHELAACGAQVLNTQAVKLGAQHNVSLYAYKTGNGQPGTIVNAQDTPPSQNVVALSHIDELCSLTLQDPQAFDATLLQAQREGLNVFHMTSTQAQGNTRMFLQKPLRQKTTWPKWPSTVNMEPFVTAVSWVSTGGATWHMPLALQVLQKQGVDVQATCCNAMRASVFVPVQQGQRTLRVLHEHLLAVEPVKKSSKARTQNQTPRIKNAASH